MAYYETVILGRREISSQQFETVLSELESYLKENNATIARKENWGLRSLSYKIRKSSKAYYGMLNYDVESSVVKELQRRMSLMEDVIRELTTRTEELPSEPSVMYKPNDDR